MSTPDLLAGFDEIRARRLARVKRGAAGLLVFAAIVFVATFLFTDGEGWAGYVRAASEAAMVGGIADWFAVTALFRHPLGIPIPHTALIPRGKDAIGRGLGEFVQRNFLDPDSLVERVKDAQISLRLGEWLADPGNAATASRQASGVIAAVAETINEEEIRLEIRKLVTSRIEEIDAAPLVGGVLERTIADGSHEAVVTAGLRAVRRAVAENRSLLQERIHDESPWWVPQYLDDVVFEKIYISLIHFIADVEKDPDHELRQIVNRRAAQWIEQLKKSDEVAAQINGIKRQMLDHPDFAAWTDGLWDSFKDHLTTAAESTDSELRRRLEKLALSTGERLRTDADLRKQVDGHVGTLARHLAERSGPEVASLITTTVERWDADETSQRLELQVGRDLQFIRINGTIVGGLAGLVIHALVVAFGG